MLGQISRNFELRKPLLSRAHELIRDPRSWTRLTTARDHLDRPVQPVSPEAKSFCGLGALVRAAFEQGLSERWLHEIFGTASLSLLIKTNDEHGHGAVLCFLEDLGDPPQ